jgi:nucleoside-diphosphate-sugar epimerase
MAKSQLSRATKDPNNIFVFRNPNYFAAWLKEQKREEGASLLKEPMLIVSDGDMSNSEEDPYSIYTPTQEKTETKYPNSFEGTKELIKKVNIGGKFLFISSSEVYSGLKTPPFIENQIGTTNTNHIRAAYIEGKRTGEAIVATAKRLNNIDSKSVRLSLAYGPGTKTGDSRAINTFIRQAITSSQIVLKDDGHAMRTYCYITDAIEMCLNVLDKGANDIYNVAGNSRVSILDLARLIAELTNVKVNLPENSNNSLKGAPEDVWLDLKSTLSLSNKSEFVSLRIGVQNTIKWQKNNLLIV